MKLKQLLKDPKKRRQFLIAGGAIAVLVILLILHKKSSSTTTAAEPESKATTEPLQLPAEQGGSGGSTGSAGGSEQLGTEIGDALANQSAAAAQENAATQGEIAGLAAALQGAYTNTTPGAGEPATAPAQAKTPLAKANMLVNQQAGNPRQGMEYKVGAEKGKTFHEYSKSFAGGVGPKKNRVYLNPTKPASKAAPAASAVKNTQAKNPREGQDFKVEKYKGKTVHTYSHAVKGGVGPKKNRIVV